MRYLAFFVALAFTQLCLAGTPTPVVTAVSPASGPPAGGTSVTITGTTFTAATVVDFGVTSAASFVVVNATTITAVTPAAAAGTVDVRVTTLNGGTSGIVPADQFTFINTPVTLQSFKVE